MSNLRERVINQLRTAEREYIEETVDRLTRIVRINVRALQEFPKEYTRAHFQAMAYMAMPKCELISSPKNDAGVGSYLFNITASEVASCLGIFIGDDTNAKQHIGKNGHLQSNAIIGICTTAVMRTLGMRLTKVAPLNFRAPIPIGHLLP